ncbi:MAG TPA: hypothetical protein VFV93_01085 [Thermomicrobiales bacterium]|nr:hypothetical protein [Thermomicrobiales bacterium]
MELTYDSATNTLRLTPDNQGVARPLGATKTLEGMLDIGEAGQLIGVEFNATPNELVNWMTGSPDSNAVEVDTNSRAYIQIMSDAGGNTRSTALDLIAEYDTDGRIIALAIPRHGHGYEITYPSGNQ